MCFCKHSPCWLICRPVVEHSNREGNLSCGLIREVLGQFSLSNYGGISYWPFRHFLHVWLLSDHVLFKHFVACSLQTTVSNAHSLNTRVSVFLALYSIYFPLCCHTSVMKESQEAPLTYRLEWMWDYCADLLIQIRCIYLFSFEQKKNENINNQSISSIRCTAHKLFNTHDCIN